MNHSIARLFVLSLALGLGAAAITGCSQDPQEKYDSATKQLKQARQDVQDQQDDVNDAQQKLAKAKQSLQDAQQKATQANQAVDKTVNDDVLFRALQKKLLDKDEFDDAAISVAVKDRVATLTGTVPDEKTHQKALAVARNQPGVTSVVDSLQVPNADQDQNQNGTGAASGSDQGQNQAQGQNGGGAS